MFKNPLYCLVKKASPSALRDAKSRKNPFDLAEEQWVGCAVDRDGLSTNSTVVCSDSFTGLGDRAKKFPQRNEEIAGGNLEFW